VLVVEAQPEVGGAVRSDDNVHPGFVHDTFSAFYPLAVASRAIEGFELDQHGLRWVRAPAVVAHPRQDGSWALLHRDREVTARLMDEQHPGDGAAWIDVARSGTGSATHWSVP
jgi:phytoene dehydrogenase-like protein